MKRELTYDEKLANLPVWARTHIADLKRDIERRDNQITRLEEERVVQVRSYDPAAKEGPRVTWEYLMEGEHALPKYANVRFHINLDRGHSNYITLRWNETDGMIDVNGSEPLLVHPIASNSVYITTRAR